MNILYEQPSLGVGSFALGLSASAALRSKVFPHMRLLSERFFRRFGGVMTFLLA